MTTAIIVDPATQQILVDPESQEIIVNPAGSVGPEGPQGPEGPPGPTPTVNAYTGQGPFTVRAITQSAYDALLIPDVNTLYLITGP